MEISIIKDLLRGTPHVIIAKTGKSVLAKSITEFGTEIAKSIQATGKIDIKSLPDGFGATDYKQVSDNVATMVMDSYVQPEIDRIKLISKAASSQNAKSHNERNILMRPESSRSPSSFPISLARTIDSRLSLVDYKASKFKLTSRLGSVVATMNNSKISFDLNRNVLVSRKGEEFSNTAIERIISSVGSGPIRRFMQKNISIPQEIASNRRAERRSRSIGYEPEVTEIHGKSANKFKESIKARLN